MRPFEIALIIVLGLVAAPVTACGGTPPSDSNASAQQASTPGDVPGDRGGSQVSGPQTASAPADQPAPVTVVPRELGELFRERDMTRLIERLRVAGIEPACPDGAYRRIDGIYEERDCEPLRIRFGAVPALLVIGHRRQIEHPDRHTTVGELRPPEAGTDWLDAVQVELLRALEMDEALATGLVEDQADGRRSVPLGDRRAVLVPGDGSSGPRVLLIHVSRGLPR